jgi:transcriptional regulator with XRE-family HTH domain
MENEKKPDSIDIHVGGRVRMRRITINMSQVELGRKLGVTFQQIQKYERGVNRMGASRLYRTAQILDVPVSSFFEDLPGSKRFGDSALPDYLVDLMSTSLGQRLIKALGRVPDTELRTGLVKLIEGIADQRGEPKRRKRK